MGSEAAIAFQLVSGLTQAAGNRKTANQIQAYDPYAGVQNPFGAANLAQAQAAQGEQDLLNRQADIALAESAQAQTAKARDVTRFREDQAQAFNDRGVLQEGSPLELLNETVVRGREEIDALDRQGRAQAELLRRRAAITGNTSRAAIAGSQAAWLTNVTQTRLAQLQTANSLRSNASQSARSALTNGLSLAGTAIKSWKTKRNPSAPANQVYDPLPQVGQQYGYTFDPGQL